MRPSASGSYASRAPSPLTRVRSRRFFRARLDATSVSVTSHWDEGFVIWRLEETACHRTPLRTSCASLRCPSERVAEMGHDGRAEGCRSSHACTMGHGSFAFNDVNDLTPAFAAPHRGPSPGAAYAEHPPCGTLQQCAALSTSRAYRPKLESLARSCRQLAYRQGQCTKRVRRGTTCVVSLLPQALYLSLAFQCGGTAAFPDPVVLWLVGGRDDVQS